MTEQKPTDNRKKAYAFRRAVMDYGMGVLIAGLGVVFLIGPRLGMHFNIDNGYRYALAGLFIVYGVFRAYRGHQKKYFD